MEHVYSSTKDPNIEQEPPLFFNFPSPFFDTYSTTPIFPNNHPNKPENLTEPSCSEPKRLKKRNGVKKDRHSKIHTAQGLRDRRMRLSLHIARKFFDLQDLLGFDKASKTIEWLFCKSNNAIKEVAEKFSPQEMNKSMSDQENIEVGLISENLKEEEIKKPDSIKKRRCSNDSSVREIRDQARARARDRTRERLMIKELEKAKKLFGGNPNEEIHKLGLGFLPNPNYHNSKELGFTFSPSEHIQQESPSSSSLDNYQHHLLLESQLNKQTNVLSNISLIAASATVRETASSVTVPPESQSTTINLNNFDNYSRGSSFSTLINHNPAAGWLNSLTGFLPGEWDANNFVNDYFNYENVPTTVSLTGDIYEQNPSLCIMSSTTNILQHVQSQNQDK